MATKLKPQPGDEIKPDFLKGSNSHDSDGSHDEGAISTAEDDEFKKIKNAEEGIEAQEENAGKSDGEDTATTREEDKLTDQTKNDTVGAGYKSAKGKRKSKRKKIIATIGIIGVTVSIFGAVAFLPTLLMKQMMSKLTGAFMDRVGYATQQRVDVYVKKYVTRVVGPSVSLSRCGTLITGECRVFDPGRGIASNLYRSWSSNRIETKLKTKYGLEFEFDTTTQKTRVYKTNAFGVKGEVGEFGPNSTSKEVSRLVRGETKFEGVRDRRHLRAILSRKYNAKKWCFTACAKRDEFREFKFTALKRLKIRIAARIAESVNAKLGNLLVCFTTNCSDAEIKNKTSTIGREVAERFDSDALTDIAKDLKARGNPRFGTYISQRAIEKVFGKVLGETATKTAVSAVPFVGWVYLGLTVVDLLDRVDEQIKDRKLSEYLYNIDAEASANYAATFLTIADESQSGQPSLDEIGATLKLVGGYGESRLAQSLNNSPVTNKTVCDSVVLEGPNDPLVCPERNLRPTLKIEEIRNDPFVDKLFSLVNVYRWCYGVELPKAIPLFGEKCAGLRPKTVIRPALKAVNSVTAAAFNVFLSTIKKIDLTGYVEDAENWLSGKTELLVKYLATEFFPQSFDANAVGGIAFEQVAAGLDVTANAFLEGDEAEDGTMLGLGAPVISPVQQAELQLAINASKEEAVKSQSLFGRYLDIGNPESLLATTIVRTANTTNILRGPLQVSFSPFNFMGNLTSTLGLSKQSSAINLPADRSELFGVTQYGFPVDDIALTIDPDELTPERCEEFALAREASAFVNPDTGLKNYRKSDPCMLDRVVVDSLTKIYDLDDSRTLNVADGSTAYKNRVVQVAKQELANLGGKLESDPEMCNRIQEYAQFSISFSGVWDCTASEGTGPWSAIFTSYILKSAGAEDSFSYSASHSVYIKEAINNVGGESGVIKGYKPANYTPQLGDLVCSTRGGVDTTFEEAGRTTGYPSHCDIVIDTNSLTITVVGGNVGNTVSTKALRVDSNGRVIDSSVFVVIKNQ